MRMSESAAALSAGREGEKVMSPSRSTVAGTVITTRSQRMFSPVVDVTSAPDGPCRTEATRQPSLTSRPRANSATSCAREEREEGKVRRDTRTLAKGILASGRPPRTGARVHSARMSPSQSAASQCCSSRTVPSSDCSPRGPPAVLAYPASAVRPSSQGQDPSRPTAAVTTGRRGVVNMRPRPSARDSPANAIMWTETPCRRKCCEVAG